MTTEMKVSQINYIQTKIDGHQVDIVREDYSLRSLVERGWSVVGLLYDGSDADKYRVVVSRPIEASHAERDARHAATLEKLSKAEAEVRELKTKLDSANARLADLLEKVEALSAQAEG